eukprot:1152170-Pelagomonas_calceolata.AAC.2
MKLSSVLVQRSKLLLLMLCVFVCCYNGNKAVMSDSNPACFYCAIIMPTGIWRDLACVVLSDVLEETFFALKERIAYLDERSFGIAALMFGRMKNDVVEDIKYSLHQVRYAVEHTA